MSIDAPEFADLLDRFEALGRRDRKAVLDQLSPHDRDRVRAAIANQAAARRHEVERIARAGRQFAGYSPWLSEMVQQACADDSRTNAELSDTARRALAEVHRAMHEENGTPPPSLFGHLRNRIGEWVNPPRQGAR